MASATTEPALQGFLAPLPGGGVSLRVLAHAWQAGGGDLIVGRHAVRLVAAVPPFTAATLHASPARLELARPLLRSHGLSDDAWTAWCDERPELRAAGFEQGAKFPTVDLANLSEGAVARLALGLRDLARAVSKTTA